MPDFCKKMDFQKEKNDKENIFEVILYLNLLWEALNSILSSIAYVKVGLIAYYH